MPASRRFFINSRIRAWKCGAEPHIAESAAQTPAVNSIGFFMASLCFCIPHFTLYRDMSSSIRSPTMLKPFAVVFTSPRTGTR